MIMRMIHSMARLLLLSTTMTTTTTKTRAVQVQARQDCSIRHVHVSASQETIYVTAATAAAPQDLVMGLRILLPNDNNNDNNDNNDNQWSEWQFATDKTYYNVTAATSRQASPPYDTVQYHSPHYHHFAISWKKETTNAPQANNKNNNNSGGVVMTYQLAVRKTRAEFVHLRDENELDDDYDDDESSRRRRRLNRDPYNGSQRPCPDAVQRRTIRPLPQLGPNVPLTMAIMGDVGQFPHSIQTAAAIYKDRDLTDAVILAGDVAYTGGDHNRWDTFMDFLDDSGWADRLPLYTCPGNHDIDMIQNGHDIFLAYEYRFRMPRVRPAQLGVYTGTDAQLNMDSPPYPLPYEWGNGWYSWRAGAAHVIMLNAYADMKPGSAQHEWLVDELENRFFRHDVTPWLICVLHTPLYNTFTLHHHDLQIEAARKYLEPVFVQYGVNLVFTGHIHAYLRTRAVSFDQLNTTGPVHITVGAGGRKCDAPFMSEQAEDFVAVRDASYYGYGRLRILNSTTAVWEWIHTAVGKDYNEVGQDRTIHTDPGPVRDFVVISNYHATQSQDEKHNSVV